MHVCKNNTKNHVSISKKVFFFYIRLWHTVENNLNDLKGKVKIFKIYESDFLFTAKLKLQSIIKKRLIIMLHDQFIEGLWLNAQDNGTGIINGLASFLSNEDNAVSSGIIIKPEDMKLNQIWKRS